MALVNEIPRSDGDLTVGKLAKDTNEVKPAINLLDRRTLATNTKLTKVEKTADTALSTAKAAGSRALKAGPAGRIHTVKNTGGADVSSSTLHFTGAGVNVKLADGETVIHIPGGGSGGGTGTGDGGTGGGAIGGGNGGGGAADLMFRHPIGWLRGASTSHAGWIDEVVYPWSYMYTPFIVTEEHGYDAMALWVASELSGGAIRLGVYKSNAQHKPGALVLDAGTVDVSTVGLKMLSIDLTLQTGLYWLVSVGPKYTAGAYARVRCYRAHYYDAVPDGSLRAGGMAGSNVHEANPLRFGTNADFMENFDADRAGSTLPLAVAAPAADSQTGSGFSPMVYMKRSA